MNELIKVQTDSKGKQTVSARVLHQFLEVETPFRLWHERMFEYGFSENSDYTPYTFVHPANKQETIDYALTLDCAKEISMIQRTEKGKIARQYFLECERKAKNPLANLSRLDMAKMLVEAEEEKERLQLQITTNAPKVIFADSVAASKTSILVGELAKILKQNGIDIGQNRLFEWMREKGYLIQRKGTDYNMPTQYSMDLALFEIKETSIAHADGHTTISKTAKVTGKGQVYFINKFIK